MLTAAEQEKERQVAKLMQRIAALPKSYQLNLTGESEYLKDAKNTMNAQANVQPDAVINPEEIRARVQFRTENYIEEVA